MPAGGTGAGGGGEVVPTPEPTPGTGTETGRTEPEPPAQVTVTETEGGKKEAEKVEEEEEEEGEPVDPNPPFLDISAEERAFMHEMHRLIPTPRAAKRYVNVYRLFRASLSDARRDLLERQGAARSRQVLLMLAIVTGFPQEGAVILRELVEREPKGSWWDFVEGLAAEYIRPGAESTEFMGGMPGRPAAAAPSDYERQRAQRWEELRQRLATVRKQVSIGGAHPPCSEFTEWAKFVARYSFESGRVLNARQESAV
jgi:hypothetical protein